MNISEEQFRELLGRYLDGTATPEERALMDAFFASYYPAEGEDGGATDHLREKILRRVHADARIPKRKLVSLWLPLAAAIAFFIIAWFFLDPMPRAERPPAITLTTESTGKGQKALTTLPDGTRVHLNSNSTISFPQHFSDTLRELNLSGEAYFEVVKESRPFIVHAAGVVTRVLGTSFNVKARQGRDAEVTLVEGKVNVASIAGTTVTLDVNEQAVVTKGAARIMKRPVNVVHFTSWRENVLSFEQTPLADAIGEIEEWYGVSIAMKDPGLEGCRITAKYRKEPLGNVLSSLQFLLNLEIRRIDDNHYSIHGKGCNQTRP